MFGATNKPAFGASTPSSTSIFPSAGGGGGFGGFGSTPATTFGTAVAPMTSTAGFGVTGTATGFGSSSILGGSSGFGQTTATSQPSSMFAGFGQTASTKPVGTATGFGSFGGFGQAAATPPVSGQSAFPTLGFGATTGSGGFGVQPMTSTAVAPFTGGFAGFGQQQVATSAAPLAGLATNLFTSTGGFGRPAGTTLGAPTSTASFVWPQQQQQAVALPAAQAPAVPGISELQQLCIAVSQPGVFGDERDATLAKWNQLQACWGTGKAYYLATAPPVDIKRTNPFCCFKAVGYSRMPQTKNEDGLVALTASKTEKELLDNQQATVNFLSQLFGNDATLSVCVDSIRSLPDGKTELTIYVIKRPASGSARRIKASDLYEYFMQQSIAALLTQGGVEGITPKVALANEALDLYLNTPPVGIDPLLWEQAKKDNPDPRCLLPVPMVGFGELRRRLKLQEQQSQLHRARLDVIQADIAQLQLMQANSTSRIEEYRRKHLELSHRVLKVMAKQEVYRKMGYSILSEEEQLRTRLDSLQYDLAAPAQYRGRLQELLSQIHMQSHLASTKPEAAYYLDATLQAEIRQLLKEQHSGLQHLIQVVKDDLEDMRILETSLKSIASAKETSQS